ncbi:MAG: CopG family transcriptional regulator [Candidatus Acidifodinimicrobium sp.]
MKAKKFTTISIPTQLADKVRSMIANTGFTSLSSFVEYVLRDIVVNSNNKEKKKKLDVSDVEEKLRRLGYL